MNRVFKLLLLFCVINTQVFVSSYNARGSSQALLVETPFLGYKIAQDRGELQSPSKEKRRSSYPQAKSAGVSQENRFILVFYNEIDSAVSENRYIIPQAQSDYKTFSDAPVGRKIRFAEGIKDAPQQLECCGLCKPSLDPCCATKSFMHVFFPCFY